MARFFNWGPQFSINHPVIDRQHEELFIAADDLLEAMSAGKGKQEIAKTLSFLERYVVEHFQTEEKYMAQLKYPGYQAHKDVHDKLVADFLSWKGTYEANGASASLVMGLQDHLSKWLAHHISGMDHELVAFLKQSQPAAAGQI